MPKLLTDAVNDGNSDWPENPQGLDETIQACLDPPKPREWQQSSSENANCLVKGLLLSWLLLKVDATGPSVDICA